MTNFSPREALKKYAEFSLREAFRQFYACQSNYKNAVMQFNQLINYEKEYRNQFENYMTNFGLNINKWINFQSFISYLNKIISLQREQISLFQSQLNVALINYQKKKKRLSSLEILKTRSNTASKLASYYRHQKQIDALALQAFLKRMES